MPIVLPHSLEPPEIRVLQEFRRLAAESLPLSTLIAIRQPSGGGEAPVTELVRKAFLTADPSAETCTLTQAARDFLAIDYKPEGEEPPVKGGGSAAAATE